MAERKRYFTGLTVVALVFTCILSIPTLAEGVNVAKNLNYVALNETLNNKSYVHFSLYLLENNGVYMSLWSEQASNRQVILAILTEDNFSAWIFNGAHEPTFNESYYYFKQAELELYNLKFVENEYYFIIYNNNTDASYISFEATILPWGHILSTAIIGFPFLIFLSIFIIKILATAIYNRSLTISTTKKVSEEAEKSNSLQHKTIEAKFYCPSCGAPISSKTKGNFCPQCGATIEE